MATYDYIERRLYCAIDSAVNTNSTKKLEYAAHLAGKLQDSALRARACHDIELARKLIATFKRFT